MKNKLNTKNKVSGYLWRIAVITVVCSLLYYMPTIASIAGWITNQHLLYGLHDFYGIDFYALVFFVPVIYAAYTLGVKIAVLNALFCMLVLFPYALVIVANPAALFRPTAFAIILSAVGAVIAMLQKSDEQWRRNVNEIRCLYDVGKAAEEGVSVDGFLSSVVKLIPQSMKHHGDIKVRVTAPPGPLPISTSPSPGVAVIATSAVGSVCNATV